MGFQEPKRVALLKFEDNDYDGAEVRCRLDVPMGTLRRMQGASMGVLEDAFTIMEEFGTDVLMEWNVEDPDGNPIPSTGDGFLRISAHFQILILQGWVEAMTVLPAPLVGASLNGATSKAGSGRTGRK